MALASGPAHCRPGQPRAPQAAGTVDEELRAGGAVRRGRRARPGAPRARPGGRTSHGRESPRRRHPQGSSPARLPRVRRRRRGAGGDDERAHSRSRRIPAGCHLAQPHLLQDLRARRDSLEPAGRRLRDDGQDVGGRDVAARRVPRTGRARDGDALRAPVPGLARGLPAHRAPRGLQLLRGVHPHRRLDVQPARQVAEGLARHPLAAPAAVAQLPAELARLAAGPQRVLAPGPGLHRPRGQQEGRDHPRLSPPGRELPALGRRPLPAEPSLRQRHRGREAA